MKDLKAHNLMSSLVDKVFDQLFTQSLGCVNTFKFRLQLRVGGMLIFFGLKRQKISIIYDLVETPFDRPAGMPTAPSLTVPI